MASLALSPSWLRPSAAQTVTFIGIGTTWLSGAPTFTPSGAASSGVSIGSVTVVSDLVARATVTTGSTRGRLTWTDSTTSATASHAVGLTAKRYSRPR